LDVFALTRAVAERDGAVVTLIVHTARISYAGPGRFDVSRKSGAAAFAPSWELLRSALPKLGGTLAWEQYVERYTAEMRASYGLHRLEWADMLTRHEVTLVCYCVDPARCHRTVLAGILGKLGADVRGERT
jgi:uncharacterized protein YeaO (DUF488 family)